MFKHSSKYFAAIVLATGLSTTAVAGDEVASPATEVAFAAAALPFDTQESTRSVEARTDSEPSCRPVRRLGGKVKIAPRADDCRE